MQTVNKQLKISAAVIHQCFLFDTIVLMLLLLVIIIIIIIRLFHCQLQRTVQEQYSTVQEEADGDIDRPIPHPSLSSSFTHTRLSFEPHLLTDNH